MSIEEELHERNCGVTAELWGLKRGRGNERAETNR